MQVYLYMQEHACVFVCVLDPDGLVIPRTEQTDTLLKQIRSIQLIVGIILTSFKPI